MPATIRPVIVTADLDRQLAFYTGLLGARQTFRYHDPGSPGRVLLSIEVSDVDALLDQVAALGGHVRGPANDMPWGQRVAHITDPDGDVVNLTQAR